jgi:hypothetical protein
LLVLGEETNHGHDGVISMPTKQDSLEELRHSMNPLYPDHKLVFDELYSGITESLMRIAMNW